MTAHVWQQSLCRKSQISEGGTQPTEFDLELHNAAETV